MITGGGGGQEPDWATTLFDQLFEQYQGPLHAYFVGRTGDGDAALELLQECFLRVWRNITDVQAIAVERRRFWLFAVARNLVTDFYRKRTAGATAFQELVTGAEWDDVDPGNPAALLEDKEQLALLNRAIQRLPEEHRTILALSVLSEWSSAEIGDFLGKPAGTVRYQLSQARKRLAEELRLLDQPSTKGMVT